MQEEEKNQGQGGCSSQILQLQQYSGDVGGKGAQQDEQAKEGQMQEQVQEQGRRQQRRPEGSPANG